jgi:hypothetical protein
MKDQALGFSESRIDHHTPRPISVVARRTPWFRYGAGPHLPLLQTQL